MGGINMGNKMKRTPVREQEASRRSRNFDEVCLGYGIEEAVLEANRCLGCKKPQCVSGCPVGVDIPGFINKIKERDIQGAAEIISENSSLPAVCGRVCPQENQCEGKCVFARKSASVAVGKLEKFVADWSRENNIDLSKTKAKNNKKVAVIGSGPAGLACAGDLAKNGYDVTVFEAMHEAGGVLTYGIPEFRLPKKEIVQAEIDNIKKLGVKIETNVVVGRTITIDELMEDENFEAVFIGSGAGLPKFMGIKGENANEVFSANEFLTRVNLMKAYREDYATPIRVGKSVAVVGGGNSGIEAAIDLAGICSKVTVFEFMDELKADSVLQDRLKSLPNVEVFVSSQTTEVIGNGDKLTALRIKDRKTEEERLVELDGVFVQIGLSANSSVFRDIVETNRSGEIMIDAHCRTNVTGIYAAGDVSTVPYKQIIISMGEGAKAALSAFDDRVRGII